MNTTTQHMDFDAVEQALSKNFSGTVSTSSVNAFLHSIGQMPHRYISYLRNKYGVGHGRMNFDSYKSNDATVTIEDDVADYAPEEEEFLIEKRITSRFNALDVMARATARGVNRAMIVSGPAGLGKSYGVERAATDIAGEFVHIKGYIRPTGLFKLLYENRQKGKLIVFDDIDSLFGNEDSLNILKAACDSCSVRKISWMSNAIMEDEEGQSIPKSFDFDGSIIFITNVDFQAQIDKGSKMAPHFEALISRSHYLDLGIRAKRDYIVRIKHVLRAGMLNDTLYHEEQQEIVQFMEENMNQMRELSLRMVKKLADLMIMDSGSWKELAAVTCMKNA